MHDRMHDATPELANLQLPHNERIYAAAFTRAVDSLVIDRCSILLALVIIGLLRTAFSPEREPAGFLEEQSLAEMLLDAIPCLLWLAFTSSIHATVSLVRALGHTTLSAPARQALRDFAWDRDLQITQRPLRRLAAWRASRWHR